MAYFNGTEMRSLLLATGILLLGAAVRVGFGPRPDDFSWVEVDDPAARHRSGLSATIETVSAGVAEEEAASEPLRPGERIDPNTAPAAQLRRLPGVGPAKASAILQSRNRGAVYRRPEDLLRVPGIGPRTLETLAPHLDLPGSGFSPGATAPGTDRTLVNVNRAQIKELEQITGIGPALAARIVATRRRLGPFEGPEDLLRVPGIGPAVLRRIRPQVLF